MIKKPKKVGADLVVETLINQKIKYIFGIPGAKIDKVFDVLQDYTKDIQLIIARHEQNAAFMAAAIGRITGKAGVVLVTSGPGASNLATGLVTATAEGDPIVAIAGNVSRQDRLKRTHQSMDNAALFLPITKFSKEVIHHDNISETITNAFRVAQYPRQGASFVSLPSDILNTEVDVPAILPTKDLELGPTDNNNITKLITMIQEAKLPVLLLGMRSSSQEVTTAIRMLLEKHPIPVVETFQAAGVISRKLESNFYGRLGLFKNQPGDELLHQADLIITIGYDPIEYYPRIWNENKTADIINIDQVFADIDTYYQPKLEIIGSIPAILNKFTSNLTTLNFAKKELDILKNLQKKLLVRNFNINLKHDKIHPLQLIDTLRSLIDDKVTVTCDVGSHYIWMARYFRSYNSRRLLFSNGMQTLGVALPWGIAAALVYPNEKVVSMSGDGGFLFSAMELETAVRLKLPLVHLIWNDGSYDMVAFQQEMKYNRKSAVDLGPVDFVKYAESFGAIGLRVNDPLQLEATLKEALSYNTPVIVDIIIDYTDNIKLGEMLLANQIN